MRVGSGGRSISRWCEGLNRFVPRIKRLKVVTTTFYKHRLCLVNAIRGGGFFPFFLVLKVLIR